MMKPTRKARRYATGATALLALVVATVVAVRHSPEFTSPLHPGQSEMTVRPAQSPAKSPIPSLADEVALRPLPVSLTSATHEWTEGDASDPNIIERIAHNPDEAIRMIEENHRIQRRQLVYRKDTTAAAVQRAKVSGKPLRNLTLPGLDGQELDFEIVRAELDPSGMKGSLAGRLTGMPNSMVVLSFKGDREAFSVSSPDNDFHLQADPREPGELVIKRIDPATYIQGQCGNPDHNH